MNIRGRYNQKNDGHFVQFVRRWKERWFERVVQFSFVNGEHESTRYLNPMDGGKGPMWLTRMCPKQRSGGPNCIIEVESFFCTLVRWHGLQHQVCNVISRPMSDQQNLVMIMRRVAQIPSWNWDRVVPRKSCAGWNWGMYLQAMPVK